MKTSLFLGGDVMTGRGIDQILRHPGDPVLYERSAKSALMYLELAEQASGPIPRKVEPEYIWGDALAILDAPSIYTEFAGRKLGGLQHLGVMTDSVADDLARLKKVGIEAVQQGHTGTGIRFAYVDTEDHPGGMIELIEAGPAITGFFKLVRDAAQGWDGGEPIRRMR